MNNLGVIVPARYQSSRFPGKPLAIISGEYLIIRVLENLKDSVPKENLWVATDHKGIKEICESNGYSVVMTPPDCLTGTDRVAEANKILKFDYVVNVQGDEPLIDSKKFKEFINFFKSNKASCINCYSMLTEAEDPNSINVPKVVFSESKKLLYISRSPIPISKSGKSNQAFKQVCIYGFNKEALSEFGLKQKKTPLENIEDIEILRLLEKGYSVQMYEFNSVSHAVDIPDDIGIVENLLRNRSC